MNKPKVKIFVAHGGKAKRLGEVSRVWGRDKSKGNQIIYKEKPLIHEQIKKLHSLFQDSEIHITFAVTYDKTIHNTKDLLSDYDYASFNFWKQRYQQKNTPIKLFLKWLGENEQNRVYDYYVLTSGDIFFDLTTDSHETFANTNLDLNFAIIWENSKSIDTYKEEEELVIVGDEITGYRKSESKIHRIVAQPIFLSKQLVTDLNGKTFTDLIQLVKFALTKRHKFKFMEPAKYRNINTPNDLQYFISD